MDTSWNKVAAWYRDVVHGPESYQTRVVLPNLLRIVAPVKGLRVCDIACGEGFIARSFATMGASVSGVDLGAELITLAKQSDTPLNPVTYYVAPAEKLPIPDASCDVATITLALQNMEHIAPVLKEASRILVPNGRLVITLNHPAFRIPKKTSWGYDEASKIQYRRLDGYLSESRAEIDMEPGKTAKGGKGAITYSFHRSLQNYVKSLANAGFLIARMEEWTSHRKSEGARAHAEDTARKEFPLFLMLEAVKK